jgi:UDP-N-acetylglucosamine/UDP-N-acetylgalactosamine diphosphorylase
MLPKREPQEKLGNFCICDDRLWVIEYSDLPRELAEQVDEETGRLRFLAGSIAIHVISVDFVDRLTHDPDSFGLPFHRANKTVPFFDPRTHSMVTPPGTNAVKLEMFVFDALPECEHSIILETSREEEFAPIKDANGKGMDSPHVSRQALIERGAKWLEQNGVVVARDVAGEVAASIEISPFVAIYPEDLQAHELPAQILEGDSFLL